ncbi:MAG: NERD domain-containing protein [Microbacteriaceae bacterium]|nr:NERD domain-containing protein [Microbacteriaceae bacterium]
MADISLASRVPGESLIAALRHAMTPENQRSLADRFFGRHPIPAAARTWYIGLLGELAVAERLRALPDGWLVLHSIPVGNRGSDIDHVLVSPTGQVLTVNTKHSPKGKVWVSPKAFLVNGQRQPYLRNSSHEALRAAKLLTVATGEPIGVFAVIVVVGATLTHRGTPPDVAVVTLDQLLPFLVRTVPPSPRLVSQDVIRHAALQAETWAPHPTAPSSPPSSATPPVAWIRELQQRVRSAARRRAGWIVTIMLMLFGMPAGMVILAAMAVVPPR